MQSIKRLCLLLIFTLFATGTMIAGQVLAADWYDPNWTYRQKITIDESMIPDNGDLSDFPVLIQFTSSDNNPVFANARSDGYDILFTESDGTSLLDHEIEEYNSSTEDLNMWVRIPVLDDDGPTEIYMYYGNPGITTDPSTSSAWNSGFAGVWHLHNAASPASDSTSNANNGTQSGGVTFGAAGQINSATNFDGNNDNINIPRDSSFEPATTISIVGWIRTSGGSSTWNPILDHRTGANGYNVTLDSGGGWIYWWGGGFNEAWDSAAGYNDGNWHMFAVTYDGSIAELRWYKDGAPDGTWTTGASSLTYTNYPLYIGYENQIGIATNIYFNGTIDELRISSTVRSVDWIKTSFNNQSSPSTFYSMSSEEPVLDLIVSYLSIPKARKNRRGHIAKVFVDYRVMNQGHDDAVASELNFYLSRDTVLDGSDTYVGSVNIPALASGEETPRLLNAKKFKLSRPVFSSGTWYLLGVADAGDDNVESDETNNVTAMLVTGSGR